MTKCDIENLEEIVNWNPLNELERPWIKKIGKKLDISPYRKYFEESRIFVSHG